MTRGRRERERETDKESVRVYVCARECEGEGIQYNCTHVYRVDGNILERILKYLLVV